MYVSEIFFLITMRFARGPHPKHMLEKQKVKFTGPNVAKIRHIVDQLPHDIALTWIQNELTLFNDATVIQTGPRKSR